MPRTGGNWVEESLKRAFGSDADKMCVDVGWPINVNGIHIPPTRLEPVEKFSYTFVRHPFNWYVSYFQFLVKRKSWAKFVEETLGEYTKLVKEFEQVDFVGKTENLYFDLCKALDIAGEKYDEMKFLSRHVNRSIPKRINYDLYKNKIVEAEKYVIKKYYDS